MHACINVIWYQNQVPRGNQCYIYFDIKPTFTFRKTSSVIATLQAYTQLPFKEAILFTHLFYKRALKLFSSFIYHVQHYFTMIQLIKHGCKNSPLLGFLLILIIWLIRHNRYCPHFTKTYGLPLLLAWISHIKCDEKLPTHFQTSMAQPLKFVNVYEI